MGVQRGAVASRDAGASSTVDEHSAPEHARAPEWLVVVWDDPINLMSYVTYVFRHHFGYDADHAERLMLSVHNSGSAVVAEGDHETALTHVRALHRYGLMATMERGS